MNDPIKKIQLLSVELANQIAAGEVVERPASVVKELLENSIDAKATEIKIELKQGGSQLIRIQDNGIGISKEDLPLALARHATSKICSFDDLVSILTLGFRGEALASVASISRLTVSSKPLKQSEAWAISAQGREMTTELKPTAHPNGTTIDVQDLFYNTPARKRFLKSDKTELLHIIDVVKKIALAQPHISFLIYHNAKLIHHYHRSKENEASQKKWLSSICGSKFGQNSLFLKCESYIQTNLVSLSGWIYPSNEQIHYFYVNGRAVKEKVVLHAIKKAMLDSGEFDLISDKTLNYVLYLTLDPKEVDVNVHPTKQEVRFHEPRFIHDFIYDVIIKQLQTLKRQKTNVSEINEQKNQSSDLFSENTKARSEQMQPMINLKTQTDSATNFFEPLQYTNASSSYLEQQDSTSHKKEVYLPKRSLQEAHSPAYQTAYHAFHGSIGTSSKESTSTSFLASLTSQSFDDISKTTQFGRVCTLLDDKFALLEKKTHETTLFYLVSLIDLEQLLFRLMMQHFLVKKEVLLIPMRLTLTQDEAHLLLSKKTLLETLGFSFEVNAQSLVLNSVPTCLRSEIWQQQFPFLLDQLDESTTKEMLIEFLWILYLPTRHNRNQISDVIQKISQLEQIKEHLLINDPLFRQCIQKVDLTCLTAQFKRNGK